MKRPVVISEAHVQMAAVSTLGDDDLFQLTIDASWGERVVTLQIPLRRMGDLLAARPVVGHCLVHHQCKHPLGRGDE